MIIIMTWFKTSWIN